MLVLARLVNEKIMIGDDITIMIVDVDARTGKVRVGIEAPKDVPVHREEVYHTLKRSAKDGRST